ncbi:MAG: three-Cys-motif partner protein TcmP, partial [Candidatus Brocadiae bacterium]|nr:three-Cys-motif partner protein TcmP [Candidatus Brocadiia bacterium]
VSLRLINAALSNWGCDCIFFFNYRRINAALNNPAFRQHMEGLFGEQRLSALVRKLEQTMPPHVREEIVIKALSQALEEGHGEYVLPFRVVDDRGTRTSHHVVFVTKHPLGYGIMKDIMAKESSSSEQGVPTFEYDPARARQPLLFELSRPLDDLPGMLLDAFAGQTLTMVQVYERHHVGRRFVKANYKSVLRELEEGGTILVTPPREQRPKRHGDVTFADKVLVTFPSR